MAVVEDLGTRRAAVVQVQRADERERGKHHSCGHNCADGLWELRVSLVQLTEELGVLEVHGLRDLVDVSTHT